MYVWAIWSVSNLESLRSLPNEGTTSRSRSKASFKLFMRRRSRAFAANRRFFTISTLGTFDERRRVGALPAVALFLLVGVGDEEALGVRGVRVLRCRFAAGAADASLVPVSGLTTD